MTEQTEGVASEFLNPNDEPTQPLEGFEEPMETTHGVGTDEDSDDPTGQSQEEPKDQTPDTEGETHEQEPTSDEKLVDWDFGRQKRDQERANELKAMKAELEELKSGQFPREEDGSSKSKAEPPDDLDMDDPLVKMNLGLREQVSSLQKTVEQLHESVQDDRSQREAQERLAQEKREMEAFREELVGRHGKAAWNEAVSQAQSYFADMGYDADNPPSPLEAKLKLELEAERLAAKKAAQSGESKQQPRKKPSVKPDSGTSGGGATSMPKHMTIDEKMSDMRKRGLIRD